jgi:hypothetical protein
VPDDILDRYAVRSDPQAPFSRRGINRFSHPTDRGPTLKAGFDTHLLKPVNPQVLQKIPANE